MNKKWLYIFLALCTAGGISASVYLWTAQATDAPAAKATAVPASISKNKTVTKDIHTYHEMLNEYVCYGRAEKWSSPGRWELYGDDLQKLEKAMQAHAETALHTKLQQDLQRIAEFTERARTQHDVTQLITVHRLLHDLDILLNGYPDQLWDVTYFGTAEQK